MTDATDILKALADPKRLKILAQTCDAARPLHVLAPAVGLSEDETQRHLAQLKRVGLLEETFAADGFRYRYRPKAVQEVLKTLRGPTRPTDLAADTAPFDAKVLGNFFVQGRLTTVPAQRKKKEVVLRYLAQQFSPERSYTEQEVNLLLGNYHDDYATLRRALVDTNLMERQNGIYRRVRAGRLV